MERPRASKNLEDAEGSENIKSGDLELLANKSVSICYICQEKGVYLSRFG